MNKPEIHLFIIWQRGRYREQDILADMEVHFSMLKQYAITWTPDLVSSNFTRFYGVNLPPKSGKELHCGAGEFLLCIVRDENPIYAERETSRGPEVVNINMFDAKERYRSWTGGGHKIHGTNNVKEVNHDLTLLIGKNVEDFIKDNHPSEEAEVLQKDIEGARGWDCISHLFYVLNNTVAYVVLRGVENLKIETHNDYEDTDILTTDYDNLWKIVNGEAVYHHVRPKSLVRIKGYIYYLDVWDAGNKYYDSIWTEDMIRTAYSIDGFRVLNSENDFYCLLYHCLTNKGVIVDKHLQKLEAYKKQFKVKEEDWCKILVEWLSKHHYDIIEHLDPSNPYDISNPIIHEYATRYGKRIQCVTSSVRDVLSGKIISWTSRVYKKENTYVKKGTPWLIDNEQRFLQKIGNGTSFPKVLAVGGDPYVHWIEISEIPGRELFYNKWGLRLSYIRRYANQLLDLLEILYKNNILHRDMRPSNILVDKSGNISIIDFGFAINFRTDNEYPCPWNLGVGYAPNEMYSDFYNLAKIFEYRWEKMPYVARFANELKKIDWEHYQNAEFVANQIAFTREALNKRYTFKDWCEYLLGKYKVRKYIRHPKRLIRRLMPDMRPATEFIVKLPRRVIRKIKKVMHL